jgi:hypothetical protein
VLLGPVQWEIEFGERRCGELDGLPAVQDRPDQIQAEKSQVYQAPYVAPGDAVTLCQLLE